MCVRAFVCLLWCVCVRVRRFARSNPAARPSGPSPCGRRMSPARTDASHAQPARPWKGLCWVRAASVGGAGRPPHSRAADGQNAVETAGRKFQTNNARSKRRSNRGLCTGDRQESYSVIGRRGRRDHLGGDGLVAGADVRRDPPVGPRHHPLVAPRSARPRLGVMTTREIQLNQRQNNKKFPYQAMTS